MYLPDEVFSLWFLMISSQCPNKMHYICKAHPLTSKLYAPRPHPSLLEASIVTTSTCVYFLSFRLANSCAYFQTEDTTITDHFTGITGTSVRKME